jgi:hypothetical protein
MAKKNQFAESMAKALMGDEAPKKRKKIDFRMADPFAAGAVYSAKLTKDDVAEHTERVKGESPLIKSVLNVLNGPGDSIERLAFENQPWTSNTYGGLWKRKLRLLPDEILKRISIQDDLVAAITNLRSHQVKAFGRPQPDRFSTGYKIEAIPGYMERLSDEDRKRVQESIAKAEANLLTCGETKGWSDDDAASLSQFLHIQARNAIVFGRIATEVIYVETSKGRRFHSFRPIDAGTIYKAAPFKTQAQSVRDNALSMLQELKGDRKRLAPERYVADEYSWVQVIDGRPVQAFSSEECVVHNFFPCTDVELDGYPVTPMDTAITAITTHINIGTHNKLYFQSGRAARGMLVIKSDDVDESVVATVQQQFNASINSVGNSWRMPLFSVGTDEEIVWTAIDSAGGRDMEFQYLSDSNARQILSAFQVSPEEIPGYAHLSRGTNNQALSESNNEYKLEAHRDVGIRPLIAQLQDFLNSRILPLVAPELAKNCYLKFVGLDSDTAEKESVRLQEDMAIHMSIDEVLETVDKTPLGKKWGGHFLLNPQWQQVLDKYFYQGEIMEYFFDMKGAAQDPSLKFINNPNFFSWQQIILSQQQQTQQVQQQQVQQQQVQQQQVQQQQAQGDLTSSIDQLGGLLTKSEQQLPSNAKHLLASQRKVVSALLESFEKESDTAIDQILDVAISHT